jgi:5-methylcytosine-specific restriction endonuclease McrA
MLTVELVPSTVWYANLRSELPKEQWDILRKACYRKAGYVCEICGGKGPKWPVECHEVWKYDDAKRTQTLIGLIALCPACHMVKHMGLTAKRGKGKEARAHLAKVNGWAVEEVVQHVAEAFVTWMDRSTHAWELDTSWVEQHLS